MDTLTNEQKFEIYREILNGQMKERMRKLRENPKMVRCDCGLEYKSYDRSKHMKSKKHQKNLQPN